MTLTRPESNEIDSIARELSHRHLSPQDPTAFSDIEAAAGELPRSVRLHAANSRLNAATSAIVFSGLRIDDNSLGRTPSSWHSADTLESRIYAFEALLFGALLGDTIGWDAQQEGRLVTDIIPSQGAEESMVSSSSKKELSWHTQDAFSPHRADWVASRARFRR